MRHVFETREPGVLGAGPTLGIVEPARAPFTLARVPPAPELADLVDWHWVVTWDLPPGVRFTQAVVAHPVGQVVAERQGLLAYAMPAVSTDRRVLVGTDGVVGSKLRPGAYRALLGLDGPGERGAVGPFGGRAAGAVGRSAIDRALAGDAEGAVAAVTPLLADVAARTRTERSTAALATLREAFAAIADAAPGTPVATLAEELRTTPRSLQRLFAQWVGVSPKWVLQRHRVHRAAELLGRDPGLDLAGLAAAVGYYDQAHFTGDFVRAVGTTPGEYARRCATALAPPGTVAAGSAGRA